MVEKSIPNLKMPPFNTTLMGVLRGVFDYYGIPVSNGWLFGGSGHAFLINIHKELCPSGPYVWDYTPFYQLVRNLGIEVKDLGFFHYGSSPEERKRVESVLRKNIDDKIPCSMLNMDNQLISGYDDTRFFLQQPWPNLDFPPKTLTFQTWEELGKEVHVDFFAFFKTEKDADTTVVRESLSYAVDLARNPSRYKDGEDYHVGLDAYDTWINAVRGGHGHTHGNWWNGTVWCECREMASQYFLEIAAKFRGVSEEAKQLSKLYKGLAALLNRAREKELEDDRKVETLQEARKAEESCVVGVEKLLRSV